MLHLSRLSKVIREARESHFLPFFNHKEVASLIQHYSKICSTLEAQKHNVMEEAKLPSSKQFKTSYVICLTSVLKRIFRVLLAYLNFRVGRIRREFWQSGGSIAKDHFHLLSSSEKDFVEGYQRLTKGKVEWGRGVRGWQGWSGDFEIG